MSVQNSLLVGLDFVVHLLRVDRSIEDYVLSVLELANLVTDVQK